MSCGLLNLRTDRITLLTVVYFLDSRNVSFPLNDLSWLTEQFNKNRFSCVIFPTFTIRYLHLYIIPFHEPLFCFAFTSAKRMTFRVIYTLHFVI